jgi:LPXTG-motif cell wall-anchored protein
MKSYTKITFVTILSLLLILSTGFTTVFASSLSEVEGTPATLNVGENEEPGTVLHIQATTADGELVGEGYDVVVGENPDLALDEPEEEYEEEDDGWEDDEWEDLEEEDLVVISNPTTGDGSNLILWIVIGVVAIGAAGGIFFVSKKKAAK